MHFPKAESRSWDVFHYHQEYHHEFISQIHGSDEREKEVRGMRQVSVVLAPHSQVEQ